MTQLEHEIHMMMKIGKDGWTPKRASNLLNFCRQTPIPFMSVVEAFQSLCDKGYVRIQDGQYVFNSNLIQV